MNESGQLAGRVCLVTGAGSGIGAAIAQRFGAEGGAVYLLDRNGEAAGAVAETIRAAGGTAEARALDVSDSAAVQEVIRSVHQAAGQIDVLANVAGITLVTDTRIIDIPDDTWDAVIAVNLRGPFLICKYTLPVMVAQGKGVIINMSSLAGFGGGSAYSSAKAGLNALSRGISRQHAHEGVRCVTIAPGAVETPMLHVSMQKFGQGLIEPKPGVIKPVGRPEEVAALAAFLASDEAAYISGTTYAIDGGSSGH